MTLSPLSSSIVDARRPRWSVGEERRQIQRRQRERIAELEKELGIE